MYWVCGVTIDRFTPVTFTTKSEETHAYDATSLDPDVRRRQWPRWGRNINLAITLGVPKSFSCGSAGKESACNAGDLGLIPGLRRSPGEEKGYSLQYSGLENSMDCIVHEVSKNQKWLSDFHLGVPKGMALVGVCTLFRDFLRGNYWFGLIYNWGKLWKCLKVEL